MLAFEVSINNKVVCTAGAADCNVLTTIVNWIYRTDPKLYPAGDELFFHVGGLSGGPLDNAENLTWVMQGLKMGDVVGIRIIDVDTVDEPERAKLDAMIKDQKAERAYYELLKRRYEGE